MATRTRQEYLKDLANNYSSTTMVDTGQKFCKLFSLSEVRRIKLDPQPQSFQPYCCPFERAIHDLCFRTAMLSFSSKKKTTVRPRLSCDALQRGAICWQVILEDSNQNTDCYLGISIDTIVLIEEHSRQIVFVTPCVSVLGWHAQTNRY